MDSWSRSRRGAAALLLVCLGLLIAFVLSEIVIRVYAGSSRSGLARQLRADPLAVLVEAHGELGYRQRANRTFQYANGEIASSNGMGFRGPEVSLTKPAQVIRIVLLGGSTTHGWGVDDHSTIDEYMRQLLAREYPSRSFEVINLAFDGYDSYQIYERLRTDGMPLQPDFVIVNEGINDVRNARYADLQDRDPRTMLWLSEVQRSREEKQRGGPSFWTRVKHYVYVARLPGATRTQVSQTPDTLTRPYPEALDYFERNLGRIVGLTSHTPAVVLFSIAPSSLLTKYRPDDTSGISYWIGNAVVTQAYRDSLDERLQDFVERAARSGERVGRIPYFELPPHLFIDDAHLTPEGNARAAEQFVQALRPLLDGQPIDNAVRSRGTRLGLLAAKTAGATQEP
jgi:lysophospholipase L1-like esterase